MSESPFSPPTPTTVAVRAALVAVPNQLFSLWALTAEDVAADGWIAQAAAQLTPVQRDFNRLLFAAFGAALLTADVPADFPTYLAGLAALPGADFQARLANAAQAVRAPVLRAEAETLLADPAALQVRIAEHLRSLWETLLAPEWQRHTRLLTKMTNALNELIFSQPQWQAADPFHTLRFLLQTELDDRQLAQVMGVRRILLVLSPHLPAQLVRFDQGETLWVVRAFDPQLLRRDPLRRAEVLGPLNALADDTRLRILELLVEHGEQRAQEIIVQLEGSQGNVSRHLKQLVGAGFAYERRAGDANKRLVEQAERARGDAALSHREVRTGARLHRAAGERTVATVVSRRRFRARAPQPDRCWFAPAHARRRALLAHIKERSCPNCPSWKL